MSTTVTYKGNTLATVSNNTKTLKTAGKYMEGDVVLTDVSAGAPNIWQDENGYVHLDNEGGTVSWETIYNGNVEVYSSSPNYFQTSPYTTAFQENQTYRVTWGQTQYLCNTITDPTSGTTYDGYLIGNLNIVGAGTDTGEPFIIYRNSATELTGGTSQSTGTISLKIELQHQSGSSVTVEPLSVTLNGTYTAPTRKAYSPVTVNVQGGASVSETQGTYGTEIVVTSGSAPSATSHTIYFEFTDETDETIIGYWNGTFISNAVTATTPTTYDSKTVTLAQLDGVTWYSYTPPTPGQWETVFTGNIAPNADTPYNYFWIDSLSNVYPADGSVWRITVDNTEYICTAATASISAGNYVCIGNPKYSGGTDNSSSAPFNFSNAGWGAWVGDTELISDGVTVYAVKIEQQVE